MAKTTRQTAIFGVEDWRRIYQTYREADFQSYDFETLRKSFVDYIRLYYPENFNDYVESSELIALLDLMAFMGQSVSYRQDLNSRENFLDTADRRDSVVRLAQLVGYDAKRNQAAEGYLKVVAVSTTESVTDYNGNNLAQTVINWNDPTNPSWQEQLTAIVNASLINSQKFGRPGGSSSILGVNTDEYSINLLSGYLPIIPFTAPVNNISMNFEITSATTQGENYVYEPAPKPNGLFNILYRNDGLGYGSKDTGFFFLFKQGSLQNQDFTLSERVANRVVNLGLNGVNDADIWLYQLDSNGNIQTEWLKVASIYDTASTANISSTQRSIYSITSRANDAINLNFGDGVFSEVPLGSFRAYMRLSNGLSYIVNPSDIQSVQIPISYVSRTGRTETITFTVSLTGPVSNAQGRETADEIKQRAPARYYTQNRMVNGEDYNNFPYTLYGSIIKSKAINRSSIGISRYLDLTDPTGKYSSTNIFGSDGVFYRQNNTYSFTFTWNDINDITDILVNSVQPLLSSRNVLQFYYSKDNFARPSLAQTPVLQWYSSTRLVNETTGYFYTIIDNATVWNPAANYTTGSYVYIGDGVNQGFYESLQYVPSSTPITNIGYWKNLNTSTGQKYKPLGIYSNSNERYITVGSLIKFVAPAGQYFDADNRLANGTPNGPDQKLVLWATATNIVLDGTNYSRGNLSDGSGPVTLSVYVPTGAIATDVVPIFATDLTATLEQQIIQQVELNRDFGIGYDYLNAKWYLITSTNLSASTQFSNGFAQNQSGTNLDASWIIKFTTNGQIYTVTSRALDYFFASVLQTRFFYDNSKKIYDTRTGSVINDYVNILKVNNSPQTSTPMGSDIQTNIIGQPVESDGYVNDFLVTVSFTDSNNDGIADNPDFFDDVVGPDGQPINSHLVFFQSTTDFDNLQRYLPLAGGVVNATYPTIDRIDIVKTQYANGQVFYAYTDGVFCTLSVDATGLHKLVIDTTNQYRVATGRSDLYFQYNHNSPNTRRIDPSNSNIIDLYVVTNGYYTAYQNYIKDSTGTVSKPDMPTIDELTTQYQTIQNYKMISDNVVVNSVNFKPLFGNKADISLQGTIKVVPEVSNTISQSEIKSRVLSAINTYFDIGNWDFGATFYFSELSSYLHTNLGDIISSVVLVPRDPSKAFGDLYEIKSQPNEIFVNAAGINDIEIISALTSTNLKN